MFTLALGLTSQLEVYSMWWGPMLQSIHLELPTWLRLFHSTLLVLQHNWSQFPLEELLMQLLLRICLPLRIQHGLRTLLGHLLLHNLMFQQMKTLQVMKNVKDTISLMFNRNYRMKITIQQVRTQVSVSDEYS